MGWWHGLVAIGHTLQLAISHGDEASAYFRDISDTPGEKVVGRGRSTLVLGHVCAHANSREAQTRAGASDRRAQPLAQGRLHSSETPLGSSPSRDAAAYERLAIGRPNLGKALPHTLALVCHVAPVLASQLRLLRLELRHACTCRGQGVTQRVACSRQREARRSGHPAARGICDGQDGVCSALTSTNTSLDARVSAVALLLHRVPRYLQPCGGVA